MLKQRFIHYIESHNLIKKTDSILLAVSGGIDSMVMLQLFLEVQSSYPLKLAVAHINHGLRGSSADRDEIFVREFCREKGLRYFSGKRHVAAYSKVNHLSVEEGARKIRFDFLREILNRLQFKKCALAHHADDQAETILMHLFRGLGLRGLGGIKPKRDSFIHPLLFVRRYELEQYAKQLKLKYITDESNTDKKFLRNRVRIDIFQNLIKTANIDIVPTICRSGSIIQEADYYIKYQVKNAEKAVVTVRFNGEIILDICKFLQYFKAIQKELLIHIIEKYCHPGETVQLFEIERMIDLIENGRKGACLDLSGKAQMVKNYQQAVIHFKNPAVQFRPVQLNTQIELPEIGCIFHSEIIDNQSEIRYSRNRNIEYIDLDRVHTTLSIRCYHPGDRFVPLGMKGEKKLQDFFTDHHIPGFRKKQIPLFVAGGKIIWIMGYRIDDRFKITDRTKNVLKLRLSKLIKNGTL